MEAGFAARSIRPVISPDIVRSRRQQKSWSQEQLAALSGLSLRTVQRIEKGGKASLESKKALASVFEVAVAELTLGAEDSRRQRIRRDALRYIVAGGITGLVLGLIGGAFGLSQAMNGSANWGVLGAFGGILGLVGGIVCAALATRALEHSEDPVARDADS
jgi:transcriptional regulator with XRE-family HTH domain